MAATIPDEFLDRMSEKFRMLSDSTRLAILRTLMQGERNVTGVNSRAAEHVITYRRNGKYDGTRGNMDYVEHKQLFDSIRVAQPINNGHHMPPQLRAGDQGPDCQLYPRHGHLA